MDRQHFHPLSTKPTSIPKTTLSQIPRPLKRKLQEHPQPWKKQYKKWRAVKSSKTTPQKLQKIATPPRKCMPSGKLRNACQHLRQEFEMILELWINLCDSQLSMTTSERSTIASPTLNTLSSTTPATVEKHT